MRTSKILLSIGFIVACNSGSASSESGANSEAEGGNSAYNTSTTENNNSSTTSDSSTTDSSNDATSSGDGTGGSNSTTSSNSEDGNTGSETTGSTGSGSSTTTTGGTGSGSSSTTGPECKETKQNNSLDSAVAVADITDKDDDQTEFSNTLENPADVDWFVYQGEDVAGGITDPWAQIDADVSMCLFVECIDAETNEFECEVGEPTTVAGLNGCCAIEKEVQIKKKSGGLCNSTVSDDVKVYVRVNNAETSCVDYTVQYHY